MNGPELAALIAAGGLGAAARYIVDGVVMKGRTDAFPLGILVVNVTGSLLLGVIAGLGQAVGAGWVAVLGIGLLGGYTTFSTVAVDTVLLARRGRKDWAWVDLVGTFAATVIAAALGVLLGGLLPR